MAYILKKISSPINTKHSTSAEALPANIVVPTKLLDTVENAIELLKTMRPK